MNQSQAELTTLAPDNLFGTDGDQVYLAYHREFTGHIDAGGEPVFQYRGWRELAPVVRPHPGQHFEGLWVPHEPIPGLVLDTGHLRLAFYCPAIRRHPMDPLNPPRLRIEAVQFRDRNHNPATAWRVLQYPRPQRGEARGLNHGNDSPMALAPSSTRSLTVPLADALSYVAEERQWAAKQRQELLPREIQEFSPANVRQAACLDVLGGEYFHAITGQWLFEELLRRIDSGQPDPRVIVVQPITRAEVVATLKQRAPLMAQMAELSRHPKLQPAIQDRIDWLLARGRALERRLGQLDQLLTHLLNQAAKAGLCVDPEIMSARAIPTLNPGTTPNSTEPPMVESKPTVRNPQTPYIRRSMRF